MARPNSNSVNIHTGGRGKGGKDGKGRGRGGNQGGRGRGAPTSPLAVLSPQELRRQAMATIRAIYKPGFKQLARDERRLKAIHAKRAADNKYYLNWLTKESEKLGAHAEAADSALLATGQDIQQDLEGAYEGLRDQLEASGQAAPGVVSNAGQATAFDVTAEATRAQRQVASERQRSADLIRGNTEVAGTVRASNFAVMAAAEANRVADMWEGMSKIGDAKTELRLQRGAAAAKEVARLLDREIEKAQIRQQAKTDAAKLALEMGRLKLDRSKFQLDLAEFSFDKRDKNRKFGLDKKDTLSKIADRAADNERQKGESAADQKEDRIKISREITSYLREGISMVSSNPKLQRWAVKNPDKFRQALTKKLGSALAAQAVYELMYKGGSLTSSTKQDLHSLGYIIPKQWR